LQNPKCEPTEILASFILIVGANAL
jgi:hypothetical protein